LCYLCGSVIAFSEVCKNLSYNPKLKKCFQSILQKMATSSQHSRGSKGKEMAIPRGIDPEGWISDDATRERFLRERVKVVVPPKNLNLNMFEREGFQFPEWFETQGLSIFVQMKGD
ncbi:hypothetical protein VIGAN_08248300, partial [Vigna angularis var. angularis]